MSHRALRLGCLGASVAGFLVSTAAAVVHHGLLSNPFRPSFCDVNEALNCTQVYLSPAGSIGDVPVAVLGAVFFAIAALVAAGSLWGPPSLQANAPIYLRLLALPAVVVAALFAYISLALLGAVCVLCVTTYVAVLVLAVCAFGIKAGPAAGVTSRLGTDVRALLRSRAWAAVAIVIVAASAVAIAAFRGEAAASRASANLPLTGEQARDFAAWVARQPRVDPAVVANRGDRPAVTVVKFNDYQCPACARTYLEYADVMTAFERDHPGRLELVTLDFPLDAECNPYVAGAGPHPAACESAAAVRMARDTGRDDELQRWLYANQATLSPERVEEAARSLGGVADFRQRYAEAIEQVRADVQAGHAAGVRSTPTFVVNGIRVVGAMPPRYFRALLDIAMAGVPSAM